MVQRRVPLPRGCRQAGGPYGEAGGGHQVLPRSPGEDPSRRGRGGSRRGRGAPPRGPPRRRAPLGRLRHGELPARAPVVRRRRPPRARPGGARLPGLAAGSPPPQAAGRGLPHRRHLPPNSKGGRRREQTRVVDGVLPLAGPPRACAQARHQGVPGGGAALRHQLLHRFGEVQPRAPPLGEHGRRGARPGAPQGRQRLQADRPAARARGRQPRRRPRQHQGCRRPAVLQVGVGHLQAAWAGLCPATYAEHGCLMDEATTRGQ
mmetsp:Transcript_1635/g.3784  ORF Transcript_1635/g.3784 Transcript_1635/m.3784 type:complete len:262 (-) Transcript_1635:2596-3381(-)